MRFEITAISNNEMVYVNSLVAELENGKIIRFDRDRADWTTIDDEFEVGIDMLWSGVYIWDGESEKYDFDEEIFKEIRKLSFEIEDDAPEDYFINLCNVERVLDDGNVPIINAIMESDYDHREKMFSEELVRVLNAYVDFWCQDGNRVKETIRELIGCGASPKLLIDMGFERDDVKSAFEGELFGHPFNGDDFV